MKNLKITNILSGTGSADYKGLDIDKFVPGSPLYTPDHTTCYVVSTEEVIPNHADITIVTNEEINEFALYIRSLQENVVDPIEELRNENALLKASQLEQDALIMDILLGGM